VDTLKPSARAAVEALHAMGLEVAMITGDHARTAAAIAQQVGIDRVLAELLPHEKAAKVRELQAEGRVVAISLRLRRFTACSELQSTEAEQVGTHGRMGDRNTRPDEALWLPTGPQRG